MPPKRKLPLNFGAASTPAPPPPPPLPHCLHFGTGNPANLFLGDAPPGFCGACILPECRRIAPDGTVQVALSVPVSDWFNFIGGLGEVLHLTRNRVGVVGQFGVFPKLTDWRNPILPRDAAVTFQPNLAEPARLWAIRELTPSGVTFGLEARDVAGHTFQKIVLPPLSRLNSFEQFVVEHQSPPEETQCWFAPNHRASQERNRTITGRVPFLRAREDRRLGDIMRLPVAALARTLNYAGGLPLRVTHFHPGVIRSVICALESSTPAPESDLQECFFHGANTGLHLHFHAISAVWLWRGNCQCCDAEHWALEVEDDRGAIGLAIKVADDDQEDEWRNLLCHAMKGEI